MLDVCKKKIILLNDEWTQFVFIELVGAIVASYLLAILYEGLKTLREWLLHTNIRHVTKRPPGDYTTVDMSGESSPHHAESKKGYETYMRCNEI